MLLPRKGGVSYNSRKESSRTKGIRAAIIVASLVSALLLYWLLLTLCRRYLLRPPTGDTALARSRATAPPPQPARGTVPVNAPAATYRPFQGPFRSYEPPSARAYREAVETRLAEERRVAEEIPPPYAGLVPPPVYKET